ncbi:MAG: amino acid adenylation domain-containing protein [Prevotella sp.]|nr:amino acid adenylation domain-containing protein [Prevotella sp.]
MKQIAPAPLSQSQLGIFTECLQNPEKNLYQISFLYKISKNIDLDKLMQAICKAAELHPFLCARIRLNDEGVAEQYVADGEKLDILIQKTDDIEAEKSRLLQPITLLGGSLSRFLLLEAADAKYIFLQCHHVIADGYSITVLFQDIDRLYRGEMPDGEALSLADFALAENEARNSEAWKKDEAWSKEHFVCDDVDTAILSDLEEKEPKLGVLELPVHVKPEKVLDFCKENGLKPSVFFTSAYALLLSRYTGDEQVLFSSIWHGRADERLARSFGMFVATNPCLFQVTQDTTVGDLLHQGHTCVTEARQHPLYSFADFCNAQSVMPQLLFSYQGRLFQQLTLGGEPVVAEPFNNNETSSPLNAEVFQCPDNYSMRLSYHAHRYSKALLEQFILSYETVVGQMMDMEKPLRDISLTADAQLQLLDSFNETDSDFDASLTIVSLFRRQVAAHPDKVAVIFKDKRYTYQQVDDLSDRLASHLASQGLSGENVVSVLIPRCEWMAIVPLAVVKAGLTYQPLDPTYPKERLNFMMGDAEAKFLISLAPDGEESQWLEGLDYLTQNNIPVFDLNEASSLPPATDNLWNEEGAEAVRRRFTMIYTSGSTGTPKGCQWEHRNMVAFCHMAWAALQVDSSSVFTAYASFGFDASAMETFMTLTAGAQLLIVPEEIRLDLVALNDYFEQNGVTHTFMTTQVAYQFITNFECKSLKVIQTGGEKLPAMTPPKGFMVKNGYGPSECVCFVTCYDVVKPVENVPIGPAQRNVKLYVVDKFGHRLPVGASGELWVSGPQVSRGYLNRPEKTAEVFIDNPFNTQNSSPDTPNPFSRVYRTGDIVRYLPDGNIQFVGRKDGQVKIRGFRVELKEIEAIIRQFEGIKEVTVQAFDEASGGKFIAAYIVGDEQIDIQALNAFILDEKPPYMVPAVTMQIDKIPLNPNGKVDKKAIPKPEKKTTSEAHTATNVPMNLLEQEIHDIIAGITGNDDFDVTTILGFAGLTSIMAIKLAIQVNKRFGVVLDSKSLAKTGTIQTIENEILKKMMSAEPENPSAEAPKHAEVKSIPLSYAQMGVYVECMKQPASTIYNIPTLIVFPRQTDTEALKQALTTLVKAHPIMTIHFGSEGTDIVQLPEPEQQVEIPVNSMSEQELSAYKHEFVRPFNLRQGPLYRFEIITTDEHVCLLADIHHLVIDGGSLNVFIQQLCDLMDGKEIEAEDATYADFVLAEKQAEKGESFQQARDFFQSRLGGCEGATDVQSDLTNPKNQGTTSEAVSALNFAQMEQFCRQHNITPAHLSLSAVFYALARFTNNEQVCITTISNGRSNLSIRNTVGMFVNTLAMSATIGEQRVIDFIGETSRNFDETLTHENYPFAQIAADYDLTADIMFAYQVGVLDRYVCQGSELSVESLELDVPKFHIAVYIREVDGKPSVSIEYDNGRYSHALMQSLAKSVSNAVDAFIREPEASLLRVSLLDKQQEQLLDSFNQTDVAYDNSQTIVSLFNQQVAKMPDNECVVYHDRRYTYREVDEISDRLAAYIVQQGLKSEDVVSVLIPRCEWMVIASLGVLKAGCAYQPLDPSYPAERLNFMMKDADAKLLIAEEDLRHIVNEYQGKVLITKDIEKLPEVELQRRESDILPENLFILLYTSGSTGTPKGCQLTHANITAFCHWYQRHYELSEKSRVAAYASYGFDACMMDIYPAVTCGASVHIVGDDIRLNLPDLNAYFEANNITHSFMTTQVGYQFATNIENHSLYSLSVGGEKLSALTPPANFKMFNGYGPTECTIFTTNYEVKTYEQDIPIGKPLDNLRLYIVDKQFNRLPLGAAGELWVSGPQVSRGYLNRPEKTAEVFLDNPFNTQKSSPNTQESFSRVYRTGDIVRYLPDGNIQFVGRKDGQVKIRGFRIELKEVEAVIRQFAGIKDVTVQAFDYESGGKFIAAYVVSDEKIDVKSLNDFIGQQKPSYMIPAATMQIDQIPLNQNQKVNRKALPVPIIQAADRNYVAPANEQEKLFCEIFADILSMDIIGATDNFFELGGTSLMVTRVIIEADKHGYHIAYGDIFTHPTPQQIVQFINGGDDSAADKQTNASEDANYDYRAIDTLLMRNTLQNFKNGERQPLGNALLTGSTGYLGIHVLKELIDRDDVPVIWCMVRAENEEKAERRLKQLLYYYYGNNFKELFGSRLRIVLGDVTQEISVEGKVDIVFNCAAVVKHFSKGTEIEDVNIGGAVHCVMFCLKTGARLIHVSTYSTAGLSIDGVPARDTVQTEQTLYFNQFMDNQYVHSKFIAERTVLEAVALHGLSAKVMRVGNLAPRSTDGEFQINFQTNSAMGRIRVFKMLGCYPYEMSDEHMEFSPINEVARSIVLLSQTPGDCTLFHPFNNHSVYFGDVVAQLSQIGDAPHPVEQPDFVAAMETAKDDPEKAKRLSSLLAYQDMAHGQESFQIPTSNDYTTQVLYRLGFHWSATSWDYVGQFIRAIDGLGYFDA